MDTFIPRSHQRSEMKYKGAKWTLPKWYIFIPAVLIMALIISCFFSCAKAESVDLSIIRQIESSGNPLAYNARTQCYGLYQISKICLQEYNQFHKTTHQPRELFDAKFNETVARWYIGSRIPAMLTYYGEPKTVINIIRCYNAGIRSVVKGYTPQETKNYIKRYKQLARLP